jgi:hypothetical protein
MLLVVWASGAARRHRPYFAKPSQIHSPAHDRKGAFAVEEKRTTLTDEEIQTSTPGETRSRLSVTDADQDDTDSSDSDTDGTDSDSDSTDT